MNPAPVEVVSLSGEALDWLRFGIVAQLAIGLVLVVLLTSIAVVTFWGSRG